MCIIYECAVIFPCISSQSRSEAACRNITPPEMFSTNRHLPPYLSTCALRRWTSGRCWWWMTSTQSVDTCSTSCWAGDFLRWSSLSWSSSCLAALDGQYTTCTVWFKETCKCSGSRQIRTDIDVYIYSIHYTFSLWRPTLRWFFKFLIIVKW